MKHIFSTVTLFCESYKRRKNLLRTRWLESSPIILTFHIGPQFRFLIYTRVNINPASPPETDFYSDPQLPDGQELSNEVEKAIIAKTVEDSLRWKPIRLHYIENDYSRITYKK